MHAVRLFACLAACAVLAAGCSHRRHLTGPVPEQGALAAPDIPVRGDFDGDGRDDIALWRPADGHWYVLPTSGKIELPGMEPHWDGIRVRWGAPGDVPSPADCDGDGRTDLVVWRPSEARWYVLSTTGGPPCPWAERHFNGWTMRWGNPAPPAP